MNHFKWLSVVLVFLTTMCVDRVDFQTGVDNLASVSIDGFISDEPGPYTVTITRAFDSQSRDFPKTYIHAKGLVLSDNLGNAEEMQEVSTGIYKTSPGGIRGKVGRAYKLTLEMADGRAYESLPDTLYAPGHIDSLYSTLNKNRVEVGDELYGFDISFDASAASANNLRFLWKFKATFQCDASPQNAGPNEPCLPEKPCAGCSICNYSPLCSGMRNMSPFDDLPRSNIVRVGPCTCCTCWYDRFNPEPIVSDNRFLRNGKFIGIEAYRLPVNAWVFQHKVYIEVTQRSLSQTAFKFWSRIKDQKEAANSLFQPITGAIPRNFIQTKGEPGLVEGIFYSTGVTRKSRFIFRRDLPDPRMIPTVELPWNQSCTSLFPNATTAKPSFWIDAE